MTEFGFWETKSAGNLRFTISDLRVALRDENRVQIGVGMTAKKQTAQIQ
jgi:hypothetical protein